MRVYPFPDRIASREELGRDLLYGKIPPEERTAIADRAWQTGVSAAKAMLEEHPGGDIYAVARHEGLTLEHRAMDKVSGNVRYFSEYYSGRKTIFIYDESVKKWSAANGLTQDAAEELIVSHEIFHHFECTKLGQTSQQYTVPQITIGPLKLGKAGIRALSEIGAHGFSYTWYELCGKLPHKERLNGPTLQNQAVNAAAFQNQNTVKQVFEDNPVMRRLSGKGRIKK
ncbi:MAG: hypothetical protein RRY53_07640 [Pseudoflavonifractor sp.]